MTSTSPPDPLAPIDPRPIDLAPPAITPPSVDPLPVSPAAGLSALEATFPDGRVGPVVEVLEEGHSYLLAAEAVITAGERLVIGEVEHVVTFVGHMVERWTGKPIGTVVHVELPAAP